MNRLHRVVSRHHHQIGRIQVHRHPAGTQRIQKLFQHRRRFRTGFYGKMRLHPVGIPGQFSASLLHNGIAGVMHIRRNHADVSGYHIAVQFQRHIQNLFGSLHQPRVGLLVPETVAKIAA